MYGKRRYRRARPIVVTESNPEVATFLCAKCKIICPVDKKYGKTEIFEHNVNPPTILSHRLCERCLELLKSWFPK